MASLLEDAEAVDDAHQPQVKKQLALTFYTKNVIIFTKIGSGQAQGGKLKDRLFSRRSWPGDDGRFTTRLAVNTQRCCCCCTHLSEVLFCLMNNTDDRFAMRGSGQTPKGKVQTNRVVSPCCFFA